MYIIIAFTTISMQLFVLHARVIINVGIQQIQVTDNTFTFCYYEHFLFDVTRKVFIELLCVVL